MRHAQPLREDNSCLCRTLIVGLEAGEHEVECLLAYGVGEGARNDEGIGGYRREAVVLDVNGSVGAPRQRFTQHLARACRPGGADHDLAAVLFAETKRLLERVGVGLVHLERRILLAHAAFAVVDTRLPLAGGDLLDADGYAHGYILAVYVSPSRRDAENFFQEKLCASATLRRRSYSCFLNRSAAFVPPKPNELESAYSIFTGRHFPGT